MLTLYLKDETGPATSKYVGLRGIYGHNKADPWKNSSGKVPYSPLKETKVHTKTPLKTHTITPAPTYETVPASIKGVGPRVRYAHNRADARTKSSGEEHKSIENHAKTPLNTHTLIPDLTDKTGPANIMDVGTRVSHGHNSVDPWTNSSVEEMKVKTQGQPPSLLPPPALTPAQHPGLNTTKIVGPRGSYGQNKEDPLTNSSDKDPDPPQEKPKPRQRQINHSTPRHSFRPQRTKQAPPLASTSVLGAATSKIRRTPGPIPPVRKIKERIPKLTPPQSRPPPALYPPQDPVSITNKDVGSRGSYSHNKADPWTNFTSK